MKKELYCSMCGKITTFNDDHCGVCRHKKVWLFHDDKTENEVFVDTKLHWKDDREEK